MPELDPILFGEIDPPQRLLMGPGPVNAHPRVLRAMSADLLGQFDPEMTGYMNQVMALYRPIFGTRNEWTMLVDGTARAGIEASLVSLVAPGDTVLVVNFGRFGLLLIRDHPVEVPIGPGKVPVRGHPVEHHNPPRVFHIFSSSH